MIGFLIYFNYVFHILIDMNLVLKHAFSCIESYNRPKQVGFLALLGVPSRCAHIGILLRYAWGHRDGTQHNVTERNAYGIRVVWV